MKPHRNPATRPLLLERGAAACRYGLPTDGAAVRAWLDPMSVWGARLAAAVATARPGNTIERSRSPLEAG